jgi:hypothetical protein
MFLYIFILCCLLFYISLCFKKSKGVTIIQTTIEKVNDHILFEKYPVVIDSKIVSHEYLLDSLFKYLYISKQIKSYNHLENELKVSGVFNIIHNDNDQKLSVEVKNDKDFVEILLNPYSVLIVPSRWYIKCKKPITVIELYDVMHLFIQFI